MAAMRTGDTGENYLKPRPESRAGPRDFLLHLDHTQVPTRFIYFYSEVNNISRKYPQFGTSTKTAPFTTADTEQLAKIAAVSRWPKNKMADSCSH